MEDRVADAEPALSDATTLASLLVTEGAGGHSVRRLSNDALRAIRIHLGMDVAFISEFTGGERVFRYVDAASEQCPVRVGDADPLEQSYCQRVVDGRLPELIRDAGALPAAAELPVTAELPVGAHLSIPIRLADGRVYGTLCCFSATADDSLNDRDLAMMRVFADLTAAQLDRDLERERREVETVTRLQAAIAGEGVRMVFQPIIDIDSRGPIGFEALARFGSAPSRGPDVWFTEAAALGLAVDLELTAVGLALRDLPRLPAHAYLAVNVSPATAVSGRLDAMLSDVAVHRVVLEITEHHIIDRYDQLEAALAGLRRRGLRIAVDDAGAGYASFRHILRLRPDLIKLDMTLTRDIDRDRPRRALASALISFARDTGSAIVAEGVETAEELRTVRLLGVTAAQGYHVGRPTELSCISQPKVPTRI
ncbi:MAG: EAL domain-containing protein [Actinomycetota bacterium]|nr:EAL domain-containing protein [Actinomycetota bacterium]